MTTKIDFTFESSRFGRGVGSSAKVHLLEEKNAACKEAYSEDNSDGTEVCEEEREDSSEVTSADTFPESNEDHADGAFVFFNTSEGGSLQIACTSHHSLEGVSKSIGRAGIGISVLAWGFLGIDIGEGVRDREELTLKNSSEKRPEKNKNGYKTQSYKDPFRKVLVESLMALFCTTCMMYLVTHKTVNDGDPVYVGAFLVHLHAKNGWLTEEEKKFYGEDHLDTKIVGDYSSDEDDSSSDEEHQAAAPHVLAKDTKDEKDEGTPRPRGVHFSFANAERRFKSPTSPNYSPLQTPEPKTKKMMCGEVSRAKKALRIDHEDTTMKIKTKPKTKTEIRESNFWTKGSKSRDKSKESLRRLLHLHVVV
ncbi:hypothetical protein R1sor_005185 [Riccia sorocarpa]|uniref:Uncharacterized protein n=1 Tax=Riccia sorocarpa TaxID=122646 RepID=A0ABD3HQC2_9MARC